MVTEATNQLSAEDKQILQELQNESESIIDCEAMAAKHKLTKVYRLKVRVGNEDREVFATAYFRKPNRVVYSAAVAIQQRDPIRAKDLLLQSMFLEGDRAILTDDYAFMCAILHVEDIISLKEIICLDEESIKECEEIAKKHSISKAYKLTAQLNDEDSKEFATAFFRKPSRTEFGSAMAYSNADPIRTKELILNSCFLEGDKSVIENDYALMCAAGHVDDIVGMIYGDLKKN